MAKALVKLFRDLASAESAARELQSRGYKGTEIGLLMKDSPGTQAVSLGCGFDRAEAELPGIGHTVALGAFVPAVTAGGVRDSSLETALRQSFGLSSELYACYEFGVSLGGVLVGVQSDTTGLTMARHALKTAGAGVA